MAVKISGKGAPVSFSLTSPPPKPEPKPSPALVWKTVKYIDRDIVVTVPFPDKIALITDVKPHHLINPPLAGPHSQMFAEINADLQTWVKGFKEEGGNLYPPSKMSVSANQPFVEFQVPYGEKLEARAFVRVERRKSKSATPDKYWSVKVEFNPNRMGAVGGVQLTAQIQERVGLAINFPKVMPDFQIARLDVAVDCIGVSMIDVIAHTKKAGKRMVFVGGSRNLESVYIYAPKLVSKNEEVHPKTTKGPLQLKLYDKRAERLQHNFPPPYGETPVVRVETTKRWNGNNRPMLSQLAQIPNMFSAHRVAYAAAVGQYRYSWKRFCLAAANAGPNGSILSGTDFKYREMYAACSGDLVDPDIWAGWVKGIAVTGIDEILSPEAVKA